MYPLHISRNREIIGALQAYDVVVDGENVGSLRNGKSLTISVSAGSHTLEVRLNWNRSQLICFRADADTHFRVATSRPMQWAMYGTTLSMVFHFIVRRIFNLHYFLFPMVLFLLFTLYYMFIKRGNYLNLQQINC